MCCYLISCNAERQGRYMKYCAHRAIAAILTIILLLGLVACKNTTTFLPKHTAEPEETTSPESAKSAGAAKSPESSGGKITTDGNEAYNSEEQGEDSPEYLYTTTETEPIPVKSVIVKISSEEVARGAIIEPNVTIRPSDATDKSYTLKSGDEKVLRLIDGRWTAIGAGKTEIIATSANGVTGYSTVTVVVPVETLSLGIREITIDRGDSVALAPVIVPEDATDQAVEYASDDVNVASVSGDGIITAVGAGTAVIEGVAGGVRDICTVTVIVPVTGISISTDKRAYKVGDYGAFIV